jgi:hypothetical protein
MPPTPDLKPPVYNIQQIYKVRDRLLSRELWEFTGETLVAERLPVLVRALQRVFKVRTAVLHDSVQHLAGMELAPRVLNALAWRLAGNRRRLQAEEPVLPWSIQHEYEWVPVQIIASEATRHGRKQRWGSIFIMRILAGSGCPLTMKKFWPHGFCASLARRAGYTSSRRSYPYTDMSELVNMRFMVLLDPERCRNGKPDFEDIGCPGSHVKWNRVIIQKRFRKQGVAHWPCPMDYSHQCHMCRVGYDQCPAATHKETY